MPRKSGGNWSGLAALLPEKINNETKLAEEIPLDDIDPNPNQPRQTFSQEGLAQLADSIRAQGILQPLLVIRTEGGRYRIVAGERRWRAARIADIRTVPCIVRDLSPEQEMEITLIENLQREDLNPMEEASGIDALMRQCGYTQEDVAKRLGRSRSAVANTVRLLALPEEIREMVHNGVLSAGHGRVLAGVENQEDQLALARQSAEDGWSVRQLEAEAASLRDRRQRGEPPKVIRRELTVEMQDLQNRIREAMGVRTTLTGTERRGRIVLQYYTREELERLSELIDRLGRLQG